MLEIKPNDVLTCRSVWISDIHLGSKYCKAKQLLQFLDKQDITQPTQVSQHHIRTFIAQRHRQGLGGKSLQRLLSAIRSLFRWLLREGLAEHNPATPVRASSPMMAGRCFHFVIVFIVTSRCSLRRALRSARLVKSFFQAFVGSTAQL